MAGSVIYAAAELLTDVPVIMPRSRRRTSTRTFSDMRLILHDEFVPTPLMSRSSVS